MSQGPRTHVRLIYDGIELVPARPKLPWDTEPPPDTWAVPGGIEMTTDQLLALADRLDVRVSKLTFCGLDRRLENLN